MKRIVAFALLLSLPAMPCVAQTAPLGWPEAILDLTKLRGHAEACVGLLKKSGDKDTVQNAETKYEMARADMDGVIAGLTTALMEGGNPDSLPPVRTTLETSGQTLQAICDAGLKTATPNTKGLWDAIAKGPIEALIKPLSDGVRALYTRGVEKDNLELETTKSKLEAAKWPKFGDVTAR